MVGATGIEPVKPLSRQESALPTELSTRIFFYDFLGINSTQGDQFSLNMYSSATYQANTLIPRVSRFTNSSFI